MIMGKRENDDVVAPIKRRLDHPGTRALLNELFSDAAWMLEPLPGEKQTTCTGGIVDDW